MKFQLLYNSREDSLRSQESFTQELQLSLLQDFREVVLPNFRKQSLWTSRKFPLNPKRDISRTSKKCPQDFKWDFPDFLCSGFSGNISLYFQGRLPHRPKQSSSSTPGKPFPELLGRCVHKPRIFFFLRMEVLYPRTPRKFLPGLKRKYFQNFKKLSLINPGKFLLGLQGSIFLSLREVFCKIFLNIWGKQW